MESPRPCDEAVYDLVRFGQRVEVPQRIVVNIASLRPGLAVLYEIGHLLDHQAIGDRGTFASPGHPRLSTWRRATYATRAVDEIRRLRRSGRFPVLSRHFDYLLPPAELWERSYAQYIALRSGETALRAEVDERRQRTGAFYIPYLWDNDDIEPVATAIDDLFRGLGWLR